ncbi:MAG: sigma-70 family RNA polymerase sigma factor [Candidatus Hydrogenedentes bacterium]|nr:sigma-70 family RNA polymerase sigma factor [Candidatus Hydrogenedentota bacterium]
MRSDADIVRVTLAGDREAFAELVERYYALVYALALASLRHRADAEDAAQESFLRALKSLDTLKDPARFGAWLSSIVRNICRDMRASELREAPLDGGAIGTPKSTEPDPERNELHELLWGHVMALPPDEREILILYYFSKHNTRAISELLSMSVSAAEKRLQRARHTLGARMEAALGTVLGTKLPHQESIERTVKLIVVVPVAWTAVTGTSAASIVASAVTLLGAWKALAVVALIAVTYFTFHYFTHKESDSFATVVNESASEFDAPPTSPVKSGAADIRPANVESNSDSALHQDRKSKRSGPVIRVIADDDPNKPVDGAKVTIFQPANLTDILEGTTGRDGNFTLSRVPVSGSLLSIAHPDFAPLRQIPLRIGRDDTRVFSLSSLTGIRLSGRVVSRESQRPIRNFFLKVNGPDEGKPMQLRQGYLKVNADDGQFEVNGGAGPVSILAVAEGFAIQEIDLSRANIDLHHLQFELNPAYRVNIAVVDESGTPIRNAEVAIETAPQIGAEDAVPGNPRQLTTNEHGVVRVESLSFRPTAVSVEHFDFIPISVAIESGAARHEYSVTVAMEKVVVVKGTLTRDGMAVSNVDVRFSSIQDRGDGSEACVALAGARSDVNGAFEFRLVHEGRRKIPDGPCYLEFSVASHFYREPVEISTVAAQDLIVDVSSLRNDAPIDY